MFSNFIKSITNAFDPEAQSEQKIESIRAFLVASSISCNRCNSLGIPIYGTSNRYRCKSCGRQFPNCEHGLMWRLHNMATNWTTEEHVKGWYEKAVERV